MIKTQGCKGAKECNKGALHPGDGQETKGAMHCIPNGMTVLLHPYASPVPPIPNAAFSRPISELLAMELPSTCDRLTNDRDVCLRRVRVEGASCGQHCR